MLLLDMLAQTIDHIGQGIALVGVDKHREKRDGMTDILAQQPTNPERPIPLLITGNPFAFVPAMPYQTTPAATKRAVIRQNNLLILTGSAIRLVTRFITEIYSDGTFL